ncbi:hypothetical protein ANRL1_04148 [Anaerolineae bacterium]|nr:hypothetical protein ANRL1_04148 [Anaerolineae bacterium]
MIVYRKSEEESVTAELLREVASLASRAESGALRHEAATELLMETGRLEAGITDALFPEADGFNEMTKAARRASVLAGHVFVASWEGRLREAAECAARLTAELEGLSVMALPWRIRTRVPEGYVHYGLYPEVYIKAARDFFESEKPQDAVCIGLRSIGTSLSAVVSATLETLGCRVRSFTLRPKGHPFRRKARCSERLEEALKSAGSRFLIVDEGPGLSGTSFSSAARKLSSLGVADNAIFLFPSWVPDGSSFISAEARLTWGRHKKYSASFEDLWVRSGRLAREASVEGGLVDISAGSWRSLFYERASDYPPTHPRHERRKYLGGGSMLLKFAGHGRYGREKLERAARLAEAGHGVPVAGLCNGFIKTEFIDARPLRPGDLNQLLLDEMASYLSFIRRAFRAAKRMDFDEFALMATRNITLGLGGEWAERAAGLEAMKGVYESGTPVEVDGRMHPVEWLLTKKGYRKADTVDHHSDQFFPSSQDISWDIASAIVEFDMSPMERRYLVSRYSASAKEKVDGQRLRLYMIAYLAFRLGYASFAAEELAETPEGPRFSSMSAQYAGRLKRELLWIAG